MVKPLYTDGWIVALTGGIIKFCRQQNPVHLLIQF